VEAVRRLRNATVMGIGSGIVRARGVIWRH